MSTLQESWGRLISENWAGSGIASTNDPTAEFQLLAEGSGPIKKDEYRLEVAAMPPGVSAEEFLREFALDPNATVNSSAFNVINTFAKRNKACIAVGDIYDIDILGPDNGSIVIVGTSQAFCLSTQDTWFDISTIRARKYGTHPECGGREFGFNYLENGGVAFYTRGVSRATTHMHRTGNPIQYRAWMAMMSGLRGTINARGGTADQEPTHISA